MKHFYNASLRRTIVAVLALLGLLAVPNTAQAGNDYLDKFENYSVMSMGGNVLRFKIPVWVYGEGSNTSYFLWPNNETDGELQSYVFYKTTDGTKTGRIATFGGQQSENYDGYHHNGCGYVLLRSDYSTCVVRNTWSGVPVECTEGSTDHWTKYYVGSDADRRIEVTRMNSYYGKNHVYIEFDWYIPEGLADKNFKVGLHVNIRKVKDCSHDDDYTWTWNDVFSGENSQSPELYDPYFYAVTTSGTSKPGLAATQFTTYLDAKSYTTSLNPGVAVSVDGRSGSILVEMQDTVQHLQATFTEWPDKKNAPNTTITQTTNKVDVPAYHKIYDFTATEVTDDNGSVTGDVTLRWSTKFPTAEDVIASDIFEIQRATQPDFSDAQSIGMDALSDTESEYTYTDESDNVRSVLSDDSVNLGKVETTRQIPVYMGLEPVATVNATMSSNIYSPGSTLYYRIRRGSSAIWDWMESDWMQTTSLVKHDYLTPLKDEPLTYTLDPEFEDNRLVHFDFNLDNEAVVNHLDPIDQLPFSYSKKDVSSKFPIEVHYVVDWWEGHLLPDGMDVLFYQVHGTEIDTLHLTLESETDESRQYKTTVYNDSKVYVQLRYNGKVLDKTSLVATNNYKIGLYSGSKPEWWEINLVRQETLDLIPQLAEHINMDSVKQVLYTDLIDKVSDTNYGRCSWDKNARLILTRTYVETGEQMNYYIPNDSIKRQEDGSWHVHFTNEAARSCVHYKYSVRLDQSNSTLKVQNPTTQLLPKEISGPDLYRTEVARIAEIATEGDKRGVLVQWQPTAGSIDEYTLWRREKGSTADFDSITTQTIEGYYDEDAEPGVTYEYKVVASYTCQGTTTTNSATVEGTRLAFGSIAGRVQYEDGIGCYGTKVVLSSAGMDDIIAYTDEVGAFLFDSLYYTKGEGRQTTYSVTPVSQSAQFRYNNTSSPTATITLNKNNCEVQQLYFDNISAVRFSGRVLYKNSSVPVRDANILINGKLVKKSGEAYKTDVSGNFEINVPQNSAFTLQIVKDDHTFEGDGFVRINGDSLLTLSKAQDGVRIWDLTKVRLAGRVVGGLDQAALPLGHGLSKNNIGENIQLVLELEGDNISYIVRDPEDLTKDTLEFTVQHEIFDAEGKADTVGTTYVHYQHKRIVIDVDPVTGEYCADLFPTKYKIIQATARGYATLFTQGKTGETIDLSNTMMHHDTVTNDGKVAVSNAQFNITYRSPIVVTYKQYRYGLTYDYYGEKTYKTKNIAGDDIRIELTKQDTATGQWNYLFGAPVFPAGEYQLRVSAHEDYYYNNDRANKPDMVNLKGGNLKVYNGMQETTSIKEYALDQNGSALVDVLANHVTYVQDGDMALRQVDFSVESEGEYIEAEPLRAYILGSIEKQGDYLELDTVSASSTLLDILRDPPGSNSYATLAKGTKYHVKYKEFTNYRFGLDIILKEGKNTEYYIGTVAAPAGTGTAGGIINTVHQSKDWHIPFSFQYYNETMSEYEITTTETFSTSSDPYNVGSMADVYIGTTNGVMTGKALSFRVVDSLSYELLAAQRESGTALVIAQGTDENGSPWYLMRTEDLTVKHNLQSLFAYTQEHIIHTVIPNLFDYRDGLLLVGDSLSAVAAAEKNGKYIFWSRVAPNDTTFGTGGSYEIITAKNYKGLTIDKVDVANKAILKWLNIIARNEAIKLLSYNTDPFNTFSISGGVTQTYSETYAYSDYIRDYWQWLSPLSSFGLGGRNSGKGQADGAGGFIMAWAKEMIWDRWYKSKNYSQAMENLISGTQRMDDNADNGISTMKPSDYIRMKGGHVEFDFTAEPIIDFGSELIPENGITTGESKTQTCVFAPNANEHLTVQVFKSYIDDFNVRAESSRMFANQTGSTSYPMTWFDPMDWWTPADPREAAQIYGSFVYRTIGGATMCPWEGGDSTWIYYTGMPLNNPTLKIENPQIVIDQHELSNIPHDGEGYFTLQMWNEIEEDHGLGAGEAGIKFTLKLDEKTNPKGLEIIIDGQPLTDGREFRFFGSEVITKTVKVRASKDYDYEDICLKLESQCTSTLTYNKACFSVHFTPVSSPVNIATPSDKWIMNTLSPKDETGYYIPVSIDGFDTNYDNFDHIELQYKLVTQPNDAWVNLCSYYVEDSLYQKASGTKKMIENGKIENYRFYGERDPMEQEYNLRAVSFCRHGSGFITRSSEVLTGTKDTRVPRVFGDPEPVDAVLGVGDYFKLRFNEAIAGNYLDEDNNFQITGYTNESGIITETCLHFDGSENSYAESKVNRTMVNKSFTVDMLVKPHDKNREEVFFIYPVSEDKGLLFGKTADNRLYVKTNGVGVIASKPLTEPMTAFTRVIASYDKESKRVRFFAGTEEVTDSLAPTIQGDFSYTVSAPFVFGKGFSGDMLEARLWTKALSTDEIANTHLRRLTGYEQELLAYYPMNEGRGDILNDKAHGANLYLEGATWDHKDGISLRIPADKKVKLDGNLMSRSAAQDMTILLWFKTDAAQGTIFSAGALDSKHGSELAFINGILTFRNDSNTLIAAGNWADNKWHHLVLTVSRTFNNAAIFIDDQQYAEFPAVKLGAISGDMWFGGNGFDGFIDDYVVFEQALPKSLVESYGTTTPYGDEMGLMAFLPFSENKENSNGIIEQVFSVNDQRQFKTTDGQIVHKVVPLILEVSDKSNIADLADKVEHAPVQSTGVLTKMNFDWSFNNDELLINLKMLDREINKREIYVTVRDVEDLNGNPMASPVTWSAFVDRNSLRWEVKETEWRTQNADDMPDYDYTDVKIINSSGKRHQFTIESLPEWLTVTPAYGSIDPLAEVKIRLYFDPSIPVGEYSDVIYATDENGLSEALRVSFTIVADKPYWDIDENKYPLNMSVCGKVLIDKNGDLTYDNNPKDVIYAIYRNECIGMANIQVDANSNRSDVYLTVYGNESMDNREVTFLLWQAATDRIFNLTPSEKITFKQGNVYGCGSGKPIVFTTSGSETQEIDLQKGWNWISTNLNVKSPITSLQSTQPWIEGDIIKNPDNQQFNTYSEKRDEFIGGLTAWDYKQMYMVYVASDNALRLSGDNLQEADMQLTFRGNAQWNSLPCMFDQNTSVADAMAAYYDYATPGDIIKSHNHFATFSADKKWVGDLTVLHPGEGYLFRRMGTGDVTVKFFNKNAQPQHRNAPNDQSQMTNDKWSSRAATNMTMIARVEDQQQTTNDKRLMAYIDNELVGIAQPMYNLQSTMSNGEAIYFLTISSDAIADLRFETEDGTQLRAEQPIKYAADAHHGSLKKPVVLVPDDNRPYKIIENDHVVIIRNGERYDITGKKLNK